MRRVSRRRPSVWLDLTANACRWMADRDTAARRLRQHEDEAVIAYELGRAAGYRDGMDVAMLAIRLQERLSGSAGARLRAEIARFLDGDDGAVPPECR